MKCKIAGNIVNCKTVEDLGWQGGVRAKAVEYKGEEVIVVKSGGIWTQYVPSLQLGGGYTGQANTRSIAADAAGDKT